MFCKKFKLCLDMRMSGSSEAKPASPSSPANNSTNGNASRDPSWLKLDVCPEYLHSRCDRSEQECPLAHPSPSITPVEGTVTCCFDFIKVGEYGERLSVTYVPVGSLSTC